MFSPSWSRRSVKCVCVCFHQKFINSRIYEIKDLDSRMGFVVCGKAHVTFLIIRALYVFSASTYDVISHLIAITSMSAEVVDGGRCLFIFYFIINLFFFSFIYFIYLFAYSGREEWGRRGEHPERKTSLSLTRIAHHPSLRFYNSSLKFPYKSWPYSGTQKKPTVPHIVKDKNGLLCWVCATVDTFR